MSIFIRTFLCFYYKDLHVPPYQCRSFEVTQRRNKEETTATTMGVTTTEEEEQ